MQASQPSDPHGAPILSPFADAEGHTATSKKRGSSITIWVVLGIGLLIVAAISGFFLVRFLNDPLRTLEPFPVAKYLEGYKSLAGSKFRGNLRVENDLGYKEGSGRLMVFTVDNDTRLVPVMIPPSLAQIYFTKGQNYQAELEVKEGGLVYANSCRKN